VTSHDFIGDVVRSVLSAAGPYVVLFLTETLSNGPLIVAATAIKGLTKTGYVVLFLTETTLTNGPSLPNSILRSTVL
jgi:hypothetical protein